MDKFLEQCEWVHEYTVAYIRGGVGRIYVVTPEIGKEKRCLTEINRFFLENEGYEGWATIEFKEVIIVGK